VISINNGNPVFITFTKSIFSAKFHAAFCSSLASITYSPISLVNQSRSCFKTSNRVRGQVEFYEIPSPGTRGGEKAQSRRVGMRILSRLATQPSGIRGGFETASNKMANFTIYVFRWLVYRLKASFCCGESHLHGNFSYTPGRKPDRSKYIIN